MTGLLLTIVFILLIGARRWYRIQRYRNYARAMMQIRPLQQVNVFINTSGRLEVDRHTLPRRAQQLDAARKMTMTLNKALPTAAELSRSLQHIKKH